MKREIVWGVVLCALLIFIFGCSDSLNKILKNDNLVRVEYSSCVGAGCHECILEFNCPVDAIKIDPRTTTSYIDTDKCIQCLRCLSQFQCPEAAITTTIDEIAPGEIEDFLAISDTVGELRITFTATGDDGAVGRAFYYQMELTDQENNPILTDFELPLPLESGEQEEWLIEDLPHDQLIRISLQAFDESTGNSPLLEREVLIQGEYIDDIPPSAIEDLEAVTGTDFIQLIWTAPGDDGNQGTAMGYEIRFSQNPILPVNWDQAQQIELEIVPETSGTIQQFEISDLDLQVYYFFAIKSYDDEGNYSEVSNSPQAMITGDVIPPAAIMDLQISSMSSNTMLLTWTAVGDDNMDGTAAEYLIKISDQEITAENWVELDEYPNEILPQPSGSAENFLVSDLDAETGYYAAIKVSDEVQNLSQISNIVYDVTSETPDNIPPAQIGDLQSVATEYEIILYWTAVGDDSLAGTAYQYDLRRSDEEINESNWDNAQVLNSLPIPSPSGQLEEFIDSDVEQTEIWFYGIKVIDDAGNRSVLSNITQNALLIDTIAPAPITDLEAEATEMEIILSWTAPGDDGIEGEAEYYELRRSTDAITNENWADTEILPDPPVPAPAGELQTFTDPDLDPGIVYYYGIKAIDNAGNISEISNIAENSLLQDQTPPGTITTLQVIAGYVSNYYTINLTWTAPGDDGNDGTAEYYELKQAEESIDESNWDNAETVALIMNPQPAGTVEFFSLNPVQEGVVYYFAIKAFDES
ncbi:MAG: hypothetical protein JW996_03945, partial [Candidatus Cloacimonetes bacterium]|nr:hypothetical protein [Candidatus Cloacimonadota bacterium]